MSGDIQLSMPPDLELYLTGWLRSELETLGHDVEVGNREPVGTVFPLDRPLVVIRDNGGPQTEAVTYDRAVAVSVFGGTRTDGLATMTLARAIYALLTSLKPILPENSPIAGVDLTAGTSGVYRIDEDVDATVAFMTITFMVVGTVTT